MSPIPHHSSFALLLSPPVRFALGVGLLMSFYALGSFLTQLLSLPLPGSVTGMILLWIALACKTVPLEWLEGATDGVLGLLGMLFVPAVVGVVNFFSVGLTWALWLLVLSAGAVVGGLVGGMLALNLVEHDPEHDPVQALTPGASS